MNSFKERVKFLIYLFESTAEIMFWIFIMALLSAGLTLAISIIYNLLTYGFYCIVQIGA